MKAADYETFVREVFLDPIRSVLIVDDDYPTMEELIAKPPLPTVEAVTADGSIGGEPVPVASGPTQPASSVRTSTANAQTSGKRWEQRRTEVRGVIRGFHKASPPMIVDIHDGANVDEDGEQQTIGHLHQSDLLVLDFELDRAARHDGTRAIEILRTILNNKQFNLVALHTQENLDKVFRDVLAGVLGPVDGFLSEAERKEFRAWTDAGEDEGIDRTLGLVETVLREHYEHYRLNNGWKDDAAAPSRDAFEQFCNQHGLRNKALRDIVFRRALELRQGLLSDILAPSTPSNLAWSAAEPRWIRCDEGFIAFTAKGVGSELINEVLRALVSSKPTPSQLFWAKLRASINKAGFAAESKAMESHYALAQWYRRLFDKEGAERDFMVSESVSRHAEMLISEVLPEVREFAGRLVGADADGDAVQLCHDYFGVDLSDKAKRDRASSEHNVFVSTKPWEGHHLATGHVFRADGHYWVCLSPMCDLVPGRGRYSIVGDALPFMAVRLDDGDGDKPSTEIMSGRVAMARIDGKLKWLRIGKASESSNPEWFTLYAANEGRFRNGSFNLYRIKTPKIAAEDTGAERVDEADIGKSAGAVPQASVLSVPVIEVVEAEMITQLRYEYALSMMHKLGGSLTRVGLDFLPRA